MTKSSVPPARLKTILNLSGIETVYGAARLAEGVPEAMAAISRTYVDMMALQARASAVIASQTGAEAGCVTGSVAAAVAVAVAAAIAGSDPWKIEKLPDAGGLENRIVFQRGHDVHYGAPGSQMIRLAGGRPVEIGTATNASLFQLEGVLAEGAAAGFYVVSHHTTQYGMIALADFAAACHAAGTPVIVDAAAEYDWSSLLAQGADLVLFSAQKAVGGPTAGIVAGKKDLVRACHHQDSGIGRAMKVGKETIAGVIAALERWTYPPALADREREEEKLRLVETRIAALPGLASRRQPDPTGNPFERLELSVDPAIAGRDIHTLVAELGAADPKIAVRSNPIDLGHVLIDVRPSTIEEVGLAMDVLAAILAKKPSPASAPARNRTRRGDAAAQRFAAWPDI